MVLNQQERDDLRERILAQIALHSDSISAMQLVNEVAQNEHLEKRRIQRVLRTMIDRGELKPDPHLRLSRSKAAA